MKGQNRNERSDSTRVGAKKQQRIMAVCRIVLIALGGGYIAAHLLGGFFGGFSGRMVTVSAAVTSSQTYELYDAYIFRDENVISSANSGYRLDLIDDGEMAGIGAEYARVYAEGQSPDTDTLLAKLDSSIATLEKCAVTLTSSGIVDAKDTLFGSHLDIADALAANDIIRALGYRADIVLAYESLRVNTGGSAAVKENINTLKAAISDLRAERDSVVASLGSNYERLVASKTGYYYSGVDGYEEALSSKNIMDMPLSDFFASIDSLNYEPEISPSSVGRMVYDYHWYAAVPVDMSIALTYLDVDGEPRKGSFTVGFYDGQWNEIEMVLERVVQSSDDSRAVLLFSSGAMDVGFNGGRVRRVRIVSNEFTGYRVPTEAIRKNSNGDTGVFVLSGGKITWKYVSIIDDREKDVYCLVGITPADNEDANLWLARNDTVIVRGQDLYDGKTVYY